MSPSQLATRSRRVTRRHYAEELNWWASSGWELEVIDMVGPGLVLYTEKRKTRGGVRLWGATASPEEVATSELTRRFLTEALYLHLHPRKAIAAHAATGSVCTEAELAAFIRAQRRLASKRPFTL